MEVRNVPLRECNDASCCTHGRSLYFRSSLSLSVKSISLTNPLSRLHPSGKQQVHVWIMTQWIKMDNNLQRAQRSLLHNVRDTLFCRSVTPRRGRLLCPFPSWLQCSAPPRHMPASGPSESAGQKTAADSEFKWIRPACDRYWKWISPPVKTNNAFPAQRFAERRPGGDWDGWRIVLSSWWLARCSPGPSTSATLLMHIVHAQATAHTHTCRNIRLLERTRR